MSAERRRVKTEELWVNACVSREFFRTLHREMRSCIFVANRRVKTRVLRCGLWFAACRMSRVHKIDMLWK